MFYYFSRNIVVSRGFITFKFLYKFTYFFSIPVMKKYYYHLYHVELVTEGANRYCPPFFYLIINSILIFK